MFRFLSINSRVIIIVMLSSAVRALSSSTSRCATAFIGSTGVKPVQPLRYISATRMFSSTTEGGETSIVDTCRDKIQKALETDDVIVKGELLCIFICCNVAKVVSLYIVRAKN